MLNEFVTVDVTLAVGNEQALKQIIQRHRRHVRPKNPTSATGIVISDEWLKTLDGKEWFLGETTVGDYSCYTFTTEENLLHFVSRYVIVFCS